MTNSYYNETNTPATRSFGRSAPIRNEYALIQAGFEKLPIPAAIGKGFGEKIKVADALISDLDYSVNVRSLLALSSGLSTINLSGTSSTSLLIGTGTKNFVTQTGKDFKPGNFVTLSDSADPVNRYMFGRLSAYDSSTGAAVLASSAVGSGTGTYSNWILSLSGPGAASLTLDSGSALALSGNTSLLSSDSRYLYVTPSADLLSITLPVESGVTRGNPFKFTNAGIYSFMLKNSAGAIIGAVAPGDTTYAYLKGTASSDWYIEQQTRAFQVGQTSITPTYLDVNQAGAIVANDATSAMVFYADRNALSPFSHTLYAQKYTFADVGAPSAGVLSSNAIAFTLTTDLRTVLSATKIDTNKFLVVVTQGTETPTNNKVRAVIVDISSGTPVFGSFVDIETTGSTGTLDVCTINTSLALVVYEIGSSGIRARTLSISGNVITVNSATTTTTFGSFHGVGVRCATLNSSSAIMMTRDRVADISYAVVLTISGSAVTFFASQAFALTNPNINCTTTPLQVFTLMVLSSTDVYVAINPQSSVSETNAYLAHININSNVPFLRSIAKVGPSYSLGGVIRGDDLIYVATTREGEKFSTNLRTTYLQSIQIAPVYHEPLNASYEQAFPAASSGGVGRYGNSHLLVNLPNTNRFMCFHNDCSDGYKLKVTGLWFF